MPRRDEYTQVAESTPFDNTGTEFVSDNVRDAILELFDKVGDSASPGFTWGKGGNIPAGTWLWNEGVPANKTGRNFPLYNGELIQIAVSNEIANTFNIEIYEHDGTTFTLLTTISLVAQRSKVQSYTSVTLTRGKELAAKLSSGSAKNPVVQVIATGTQTL